MSAHRAYTRKEVCEKLAIPRRTFYDHLKNGQLPMLEELKPRIGRVVRYRADLVDRYLDGQFGQSRSFASHRRIA